MKPQQIILMILGTLAAIALGPACIYLSQAHAASMQLVDPTPGMISAVDGGWQLFEQQGPIWGGMALATAFGVAFLKRNESKHWIAQGRTLAIIVAVVGTLASVLSAKFSGTAWSGVLVTAAMAFFKLMQPVANTATTVPIVPTVAPDAQAGGVRVWLLFVLAGPAIGLAVGLGAVACSGSTKYRAAEGVVAFLDCESPHVDAQMLADAKLLAKSAAEKWLSGAGTIDTAGIKADAKPLRSDLLRCAFDAAMAAVAAPPATPAPDAPMARARPVDAAQVRAAWASVRGELGWPAEKASP